MAPSRIFFTSCHWDKGLGQVQQDEPYYIKRKHHYHHEKMQCIDKYDMNQPSALPLIIMTCCMQSVYQDALINCTQSFHIYSSVWFV